MTQNDRHSSSVYRMTMDFEHRIVSHSQESTPRVSSTISNRSKFLSRSFKPKSRCEKVSYKLKLWGIKSERSVGCEIILEKVEWVNYEIHRELVAWNGAGREGGWGSHDKLDIIDRHGRRVQWGGYRERERERESSVLPWGGYINDDSAVATWALETTTMRSRIGITCPQIKVRHTHV